MSELLSSYSSANVFPAKILHHEKLINSCLHHKKVFPIHLQLNLTNSCQLDCSFCSCSGRDKTLQLSKSEVSDVMEKVKQLGCESTTLTGGGEPLVHKDINDILWMLDMLNIQVGLVTNGLRLNRIESATSKGIVWCRISSSDELPKQLERIGKTPKEWFEIIENACEENPHIDWAFSYVLTEKPNLSLIEKVIEFANNHGFTHNRIVHDILRTDRVGLEVHTVKWKMTKKGVDTSKVIYQPRQSWMKGQNPCYISLLKPVVDAKGYVLPCCGVQYALANQIRDYEPSMRMGKAVNLDKLVEEQTFFNGEKCVCCYYSAYNFALGTLLGDLKHVKFV